MRSVSIGIVALALLAAPAHAEDKPPLVVLDMEAKGGTPLQAEAATQATLRGLRALEVFQVLGSSDLRTLLSIERQRQLLGGQESATNGLTDLRRALGAQHVVAGSIAVLGKGLHVELRLLDTATTRVLAQKNLGPLPGVEEIASKVPSLAQELVGALLQAQRGSLLVRCKEEAAEILVDDVVVASTPQKEEIKLPRGAHRLQVRRDGFIAQTRTVSIRPDQTSVEEVILIPSPDYAEAYQQRHGRLRVGAYLTTGLALAALGSAVYLDRAITEPTYRQDFLPRQLALQGKVLSQVTPANLAENPEFVAAYSACGSSPTTCAEEAKGFQQQLQTQQIISGGLLVVGTASALVAGYLWVTGEDPNRYTHLVATVAPGPSGLPALAVAGHF